MAWKNTSYSGMSWKMNTATKTTLLTPFSVVIEDPDVAYQLAQFCKRVGFDTFLQYTAAHLTYDDRKERAYQMIAGIEAVGRALAEKGFEPR
ncbi:MAG: hypothetical protein ACK53F_07710 [Betaproteobacteria bacterium]|jgi:hypothetical protein